MDLIFEIQRKTGKSPAEINRAWGAAKNIAAKNNERGSAAFYASSVMILEEMLLDPSFNQKGGSTKVKPVLTPGLPKSARGIKRTTSRQRTRKEAYLI